MNVQDIITEFGNYYINQNQNMARLVRQLRFGNTTQLLFKPVITDDTLYRASEVLVGRLLQPFQKAFTPITASEVNFRPIAIEQFKQKMDVSEYPDDLEATWLGFLAGEGINRAEWPFVRWYVEMELIPQLQEDYEVNEIYKGVYAAPTANTPGAAGTSMDGIRKQINGFITAGRTTPIATGALDQDPLLFCNQIEDFVDQINERYWGIPMQLAMNPKNARRFMRGYRAKYGDNMDFKQNTDGKVDLTMVNVTWCNSMIGSDKIWMTPYANTVRLSKKSANQTKVFIEPEDRKVKLFTDFWNGVGFHIPEIIFTNDLDLV